MADQFLGIQGMSGTPTVIGANPRAAAGTKAGDAGDFPEVLGQALLGGKSQMPAGSKEVVQNPPGSDAGNEKEKDDPSQDSQISATLAALVVPVAVAPSVILATPEGAVESADPAQAVLTMNGDPLKNATTLEAALAHMEPVNPEAIQDSSLLMGQGEKNDQSPTSDISAQQPVGQESRPVYKLLRDVALGIISSDASLPTGAKSDRLAGNGTPSQTGANLFATDIAGEMHASIARGAKQFASQQLTMASDLKSPVASDGMKPGSPGNTRIENSDGMLHNQARSEAAGSIVQTFGLPNREPAAPQPMVEVAALSEPIHAAPVSEPAQKASEPNQRSGVDARTARGDQGPKSGESAPLPQGAGVNAMATERQANDSLFGKNMASPFHQQLVDSASGVVAGKESAPGTGTGTPMLTPELSRSILDQVAKGLALQIQGKVSEMRLTLKPESLGEMAVKVRVEDGKMQAQIDVSQPAVKAVVETNLPQLRQALNDNGIEVQRIDVFATTQDAARESNGSRGDKPRHRGGRRGGSAVEATEQNQTARMMGYNTMEIII